MLSLCHSMLIEQLPVSNNQKKLSRYSEGWKAVGGLANQGDRFLRRRSIWNFRQQDPNCSWYSNHPT
jgi:hypothetical protein